MFYVGFRYEVIAVQHDPRPEGSSGYNFRKRLAMAVNSILSYTDLPQRLLINFGAVTIIGSIVYAIALVVRYILARGQLPRSYVACDDDHILSRQRHVRSRSDWFVCVPCLPRSLASPALYHCGRSERRRASE